MVSNFECGICASDVVELRKNCVFIAGQDKICNECFQQSIVPELKASIDEPSKYPYHWGSNPLHFQKHRAYLSDDDWKALITGYEAKTTELETSSADRVYCHEDGTFLGSKPRRDSVRGKTECPSCKRILCMLCGRQCPREGQDSHVCRRTSLEDAYQDKQKRLDYQRPLEGREAMSPFRTSCDHHAIFDGQGTEIVHDAFIPEAVELRLQVVVATSREVLRPMRDMIHQRYLRDGSEVSMTPEIKELFTDFQLMLQNRITNLGALDFAERGDMDFERWQERHEQIWGFLDTFGGVEMTNRLQGLWEVWKTYAGIEIWVEDRVIQRARLDTQGMNRFTAMIAEMRFE